MELHLKDFLVYNIKNNNKGGANSNVKESSLENFGGRKFLLEVLKPLYENIDSIKTQVENLSQKNDDKKINRKINENENDEIYDMKRP